MKKQIEYIKVSELQLNPNNPRHNDEAVDTVALSIQKYGFNNPLIVWNGVVYCGNTRLKAAQKLGLKEVPCIVVNDLTEQQIREYALIDNKSSEIAEWDYEMLQEELDVLDLGEFELDWGVKDFVEEDQKITQPKYELTILFENAEDLQKVKEVMENYEHKSIKVKIEE